MPKPKPMTSWAMPGKTPYKPSKIVIGSLDDVDEGIEAQYNPKELSIEKSIPWTPHKVPRGDQPILEFTGGDGRSLNVELLFDGYEQGKSVRATVDALTRLSLVRDFGAGKEHMLRPHLVAVIWGHARDGLPAFRGVIESISTTFTMFRADGAPVRATCKVKIKEAGDKSTLKGVNPNAR